MTYALSCFYMLLSVSDFPRIQPSISCIGYGTNSFIHIFKIRARIAWFARSFSPGYHISLYLLWPWSALQTAFLPSQVRSFPGEYHRNISLFHLRIAYQKKRDKNTFIFLILFYMLYTRHNLYCAAAIWHRFLHKTKTQ